MNINTSNPHKTHKWKAQLEGKEGAEFIWEQEVQ